MIAIVLLGQAGPPTYYGPLITAGMLLLVIIGILLAVRGVASRYQKIPPSAVGIFYGMRYPYRGADGRQQVRGYRVVSGGGALLWPFFEHMQMLSTAAFQIPLSEPSIPSKDDALVCVTGVATCKISTAPEDLQSAVAAFLGKEDRETEQFARNILLARLRAVIRKTDLDEILRQRDTLDRRLIDESTEELKRLGIQILSLVVQDVHKSPQLEKGEKP